MRSHDSIRYYEHHAFQLGKDRRPADPQLVAPFLEALPPNSRVIDLGCGVGSDLLEFSRSGHRAVGMDASEGMTREARKVGLEVLQKNFLFWTPSAGEWDGVWANRAFQHLTAEEAQRVVASAFRGLVPGGILGVIVPEGTGAYEDRAGDLTGPSRWIHLYTENQLCSMVEQTGFQILKVGRRETPAGPELLILAKRTGKAA